MFRNLVNFARILTNRKGLIIHTYNNTTYAGLVHVFFSQIKKMTVIILKVPT